MRVLLSTLALLAALLAAVPVQAQSYFFGGSGGAVANASTTTVNVGSIQVSATTGAPGGDATVGTVSAELSAITVYIHSAQNNANRYLCDLSFDNGLSWAVQKLYAQPATVVSQTRVVRYDIPIRVPVGIMKAKCQSNSAATVVIDVTGEVATSTRPPGYTSFVALNADTTNVYAGATNVPLTNTWTPQLDPTIEAYGAVIASASSNGTVPDLNQLITVSVGSGPTGGGSQVEFGRFIIGGLAGNPPMIGAASPAFPVAIPAGVALYARAQVGGVTTPNIRVGLYGLK